MLDDKSALEKQARELRHLADKVESEERDIDPIDLFLQWRELNCIAIGLLFYAEQFKCPIRTQTLMDISHALDDDALPVDFYKRLILIHNEVRKAGNRRTKNQMRDMFIKRTFELCRAGFWIYRPEDESDEDLVARLLLTPVPRESGRDHQMKAGPGDQEGKFVRSNYENTLKAMAEVLHLSEKAIEKIVSKKAGDSGPFEPLIEDDFMRLQAECEKRRTKILRDSDEKEIP